MDKVKAVENISVTNRVSNADNPDRAYTISAEVTERRGAVEQVNNGQLRDNDANPQDAPLATFNQYGTGSRQIVFSTTDHAEDANILAAITAFFNAVNEKGGEA